MAAQRRTFRGRKIAQRSVVHARVKWRSNRRDLGCDLRYAPPRTAAASLGIAAFPTGRGGVRVIKVHRRIGRRAGGGAVHSIRRHHEKGGAGSFPFEQKALRVR